MRGQNTKYKNLQNNLFLGIVRLLTGPWKIRSLYFLSLLSGFYISSNLFSYLINRFQQRIFIILLLILLLELFVRLRTNVKSDNMPVKFILIDNFRIGTTYAVVLEAFKLGS